MTPDVIKYELWVRRRHTSMSRIGREMPGRPRSRQAVAAVIERKIVSGPIMRAVASAIDRPVEYVFPEHFVSKNGR